MANRGAVSDPSHHRYGQHLSANEVNDLVKPSSKALDQVHQWLQANNISESKLQYSSAKDWIKVTLPVSSVEQLLDTKYSVYKHTDGTHLIRTPKWSLPLHLHEHIETIQPTNSFLRPRAKRSNLKTLPADAAAQYTVGSPFVAAGTAQTVEDVCNVTAVTPLCLRTLYGTSTLSGRI
jgi:tripeptidyl-peptidase-1